MTRRCGGGRAWRRGGRGACTVCLTCVAAHPVNSRLNGGVQKHICTPGMDNPAGQGVAVIMTQRDTAARYAELAAGQEAVESCLLDCVAEHLNGGRRLVVLNN